MTRATTRAPPMTAIHSMTERVVERPSSSSSPSAGTEFVVGRVGLSSGVGGGHGLPRLPLVSGEDAAGRVASGVLRDVPADVGHLRQRTQPDQQLLQPAGAGDGQLDLDVAVLTGLGGAVRVVVEHPPGLGIEVEHDAWGLRRWG